MTEIIKYSILTYYTICFVTEMVNVTILYNMAVVLWLVKSGSVKLPLAAVAEFDVEIFKNINNDRV